MDRLSLGYAPVRWVAGSVCCFHRCCCQLERLPELAAVIKSDKTEEEHLEAITRVRKLLSVERNPPIDPVIEAGVVPFLVRFLHSPNPKIQFESAWALTNIASGTSAQTQLVVESGAIPVFVELLSSPSPEVPNQAVWALGNIAGDSPQCRDYVLKVGALPGVIGLLSDKGAPITTTRNTTWTL